MSERYFNRKLIPLVTENRDAQAVHDPQLVLVNRDVRFAFCVSFKKFCVSSLRPSRKNIIESEKPGLGEKKECEAADATR